MEEKKSGSEVLDQKSRGNIASGLQKFRDYCLTIWTDESLQKVKDMNWQYLLYAPETCPSTGKFHYQTYVYFKSQISLKKLREELKGNFVTPARGEEPDQVAYIKGPYNKNGKVKPINPQAVELGIKPQQGKRNDLTEFKEAVYTGKRGYELDEEFLEIQAKFPKLEQHLIRNLTKKKAKERYLEGKSPEVHIRWGKSRTGKSRYIWEKHGVDNVYCLNTDQGSANSLFWDGYEGQPVILLDEFEGQIPFRVILQLLDRYPFRMAIKGDSVYSCAEYIYFTSNLHPKDWDWKVKNKEAFYNRITSCEEIKPMMLADEHPHAPVPAHADTSAPGGGL